ncbi:hypothetical protein FIBSPDRAFT_939154 [Athelia psychrophila]|uniref:Uncharacterized protein n=1 Tax=Athelia psychrophila TaxID=1759441 RepID=A0A165X0K1_9AGAM|nr:hypothetical protein FIBSPDRAFT_939154 [Fibularhizoctonia sp. CBS 109695]
MYLFPCGSTLDSPRPSRTLDMVVASVSLMMHRRKQCPVRSPIILARNATPKYHRKRRAFKPVPSTLHHTYTECQYSATMESLGSPTPRPLAYIPSIPIFDPLEFDRSLPPSKYTLVKTEDLRNMYMEVGRVQAYLHNLINHGDDAPSLAIDDSKQAKPAAVERVPPEILSMIFEEVVPPQTDDEDPRETHRLAEVLLPGQICRSWREAAIATPSLWSSLYFSFSLPKKSVEKMVDIATTCISRAKNYPLSVCLGASWNTELAPYRPIITVLLAHSHQWDSFFINSGMGLVKNAHKEIQDATGRLPMLRRLNVDYGNIEQWGSFDTFLISPKLRIVDLWNHGVQNWHEIGQFPLLPWRQLQQINFTGRAMDALELLRMSPSLQVFKTCLFVRSERLRPVHHASLRELSVESDAASDFFGAVTLPALVSLSYKSESQAFPGVAVTSFVQRSTIEQSIHTFSLTLGESQGTFLAPSSEISDCLAHMPGLSQLSLQDRNKRYTDTGTFHSGDISSICELLIPILPKLERFSITGPPQMSCVYLVIMVGSRWRHMVGSGPVRIQSVEVNYSEPCAHAKSSMTHIPAHIESRESGRALALLRQYRSEGLRVVGSPVDEDECIECIKELGYDAFGPYED